MTLRVDIVNALGVLRGQRGRLERNDRRRRALARRCRRCSGGGRASTGRRTCGTPASVVCGRGSVTFHCCHSRRGGRECVVVFKCDQCNTSVSVFSVVNDGGDERKSRNAKWSTNFGLWIICLVVFVCDQQYFFGERNPRPLSCSPVLAFIDPIVLPSQHCAHQVPTSTSSTGFPFKRTNLRSSLHS